MKKAVVILCAILLLLTTACSDMKGKEDLMNKIANLENENESLKEEIELLKKDNEMGSKNNLILKNELERLKIELTQGSIKKEETKNAELELEVIIEDYQLNGEVSFSIETNLPNSTEAIITLENDKDYIAQDKVIIYGGRAETSYFSDQDKPMPKGDYTVEFSLPYSQVQPEDVQRVLGNDYKYLISDKKEKGQYGVTVSVVKKITIK